MAKRYPVSRKFELQISGSADTKAIVRADRVASGINHRLYRQSRAYTATVDLHVNAPAGSVIDVYALADTWYAMKAYQYAHKTYVKNTDDERKAAGTMAARWNDFRVDHGLGTAWQKDMVPLGNNLEVAGSTSTFGTANTEYEFSEVTDAGGTARTFRWSGTGGNTFNIIDEYDRTGNAPSTPAFPGIEIGYDSLEDEMQDASMEHLQDDGNRPPYNRTNFENSVWVKVGTLSVNAAGQQKLSTGFFVAPAGLIAIESSVPLDPSGVPILSLELKAGDYKGIHAPSYLE